MNNPELTIQDVAKAAGVSPATVSRVMTGSAGVKSDKAARVRAVIEQLGYRPNPFARSLSQKSSRTIGVLVPQLADDFYGQIITGVDRELRLHGLQLHIALAHNNPEEETSALTNFAERQVDGMILIAHHISDQTLLGLKARRLPVVLINRSVPELSNHCINLDNVQGGFEATQHLLELGHRRIAHISGDLEIAGARERLEGYRMALRDAGIEPHEDWLVEASFSEEYGRHAMQRLLARTQVSALFAASDSLAVGAMIAAREAGLRLPQDLSIIGFDDRNFARYVSPALTTMHYPMLEMGISAAQHIIAQLREEPISRLERFQAHLVERASTQRQA
jgi:LacI family transcriptional regulator